MKRRANIDGNGSLIRLSGSKKTITIIIAALIICAAIIAVVDVTEMRYEKEIALCQALSDGGVESKEAISVVNAINALATNDAKKYFIAARSFAKVNSAVWGNALVAYGNPNTVKSKSMFACVKYLSAVRSLKFDAIKGDGFIFEKLSDKQKKDATEVVVALSKGVAELGEERYSEFIAGLKSIKNAKDVFKEISYKTIYKTAEYAIKALKEIDMAKLSFGDVVFGDGFCEETKNGLNILLRRLNKAEYSDFVDVIGYYPNTDAILVCAVKFLFDKGELDDVAKACAFFAKFGGDGTIVKSELKRDFDRLLALNPDELTEYDNQFVAESKVRLSIVWKGVIKMVEMVIKTIK